MPANDHKSVGSPDCGDTEKFQLVGEFANMNPQIVRICFTSGTELGSTGGNDRTVFRSLSKHIS